MKKILISVVIIVLIILLNSIAFATDETTVRAKKITENVTEEIENPNMVTEEIENPNMVGDIIEIKEETQEKINEYVEKYGSESYGMVAYILNIIRIYSIPFCFVGIAIGGIYQYAIGTRRLDMKQKGFALILSFITILVICQILPLIFAIVVKGWRN